MKVIDHLKQAKETLFSIEILPPVRGKGIESIFQGIEPLMEFKPAFIDVTYHREEFVYRSNEKGLTEKILTRKRPGTVGISAAIMNRFHVDVVPHLLCGGFTREETEGVLIDLNFLGIDTVFALRGDKVKSEPCFIPTPGGNAYAIDLTHQIDNLNKGKYLDNTLENPTKTDFCIGVAGYPEIHEDADNLLSDIMHLKNKIEAGAEYVVTQMFFDNSKFFKFVEMSRAAGITVPIVPGLKPLVTKKQLEILPKIFNLQIPEDLKKAVEGCKNDKEAYEIGTDWCIQQSIELKKAGVPSLHYYTMGKSEATRKIALGVF